MLKVSVLEDAGGWPQLYQQSPLIDEVVYVMNVEQVDEVACVSGPWEV